eukprot:TRINITY_DN3905_c0_g1_i1.p1 TRINITY_DN3905_c0_g1~~TRINITY_DN3905_c0_g1_i1.p1  ORF type:complete len:233 (+),score=18.35 TRINITY_DN3905_c0_g1_i1:77-775(+)
MSGSWPPPCLRLRPPTTPEYRGRMCLAPRRLSQQTELWINLGWDGKGKHLAPAYDDRLQEFCSQDQFETLMSRTGAVLDGRRCSPEALCYGAFAISLLFFGIPLVMMVNVVVVDGTSLTGMVVIWWVVALWLFGKFVLALKNHEAAKLVATYSKLWGCEMHLNLSLGTRQLPSFARENVGLDEDARVLVGLQGRTFGPLQPSWPPIGYNVVFTIPDATGFRLHWTQGCQKKA